MKKNNFLTKEQVVVVKNAIISSMRDAYTSNGAMPNDGFNSASSLIADKIISNVQKALKK